MKMEKTYDVVTEQDVLQSITRPQGVNVPEAVSIQDIVYATDESVLLIGELHDQFAHHYNQLAVIIEMHKRHKEIAIGLEMFQRPFQNVLNAYVAGEISEMDMLKQTEYFDRWSFDYLLYKPIMDYAVKNHIKLLALNASSEITKKVSGNGLDNLTESEWGQIAQNIDKTDEVYKDKLKKIFNMHPNHSEFEHFYEAQLVWDETMAETAASHVVANPAAKLVVLAGNGHIHSRHGLQNRIERRIGGGQVVAVVQDMPLTPEVADFVLFPEYVEIKPSPKLGVMLKVQDDGLLVQHVTDNSAAAKAGVQKGDVLIKAGDQDLKKVSDLKLMLYTTGHDGEMTVMVQRDDAVLNIVVKL